MRLYLLIIFLLLAQLSFSQDAWQNIYSQAQTRYEKGNLRQSYHLGRRALIQAKMEYGVGSERYADNLRLLTLIAYSSSDFEEGINYGTEEVSSRQQLGQSGLPVFGQALYNLGRLYMATAAYDKAVSYLQPALNIFKDSPSGKLSLAHVQYQLGMACLGLHQTSTADSLFQEAIHFSEKDSLFREISFQAQYQRALIRLRQQESEGLKLMYKLKENLEQQKDTFSSLYLNTLCLLASKEGESGYWQKAAGLYKEAKVLLDSSGSIPDSLTYAYVLDEMGDLALIQDSVRQAEEWIGEAYQIRRRHLSPEKDVYWASVDHMAQVYQEKGDNEEAVRFYEEHIRGVAGERLPYQYAVVLSNLALLYWEGDQYVKAGQYYKQAVEQIENADTSSSDVQRHKASLYYNAARNYQSKHHFDTAIYYYKKSIDLSREYAGEQSTEYMAALSGIASLYQDIGYLTEAEIFYQEALQIQEVISGKENNEYANLLNNFALLAQAKGDYRQAETLLKEVLNLKKKLIGENALQTIAVASNIGLFYLDIAAYQQARPLLEKALAINQQQRSNTDPALIFNLLNLARLEMAEANYTKAEPLLKEAAHLAKLNYGTNHPDFAIIQLEQAHFYLALGNYGAAESLLQESQHILQTHYGTFHPDYATATQDLAILYEATGRYERAEELFKETLEIDRKTLGKQHPDYAISLNNLASFYQNTGKHEEAQGLLEESLSITRNVFGKEHPAYMATLLNLGLLYQDLEQYERAGPLLDEVVELRKKILGENHPDYAYALYGKAVLFHRLGKYQEAAPVFREVVSNYIRQIKAYFPALSEKEKSAFYKRIEPVLNAYRDFVVDVLVNKAFQAGKDEMLGELYNVQLVTKAMLLDASSKIRSNILNSGSQELMQTYQTWIGIKEKLAQAYTFSRQLLQEKGINIKDLEGEANELEKELSAGSVLFAQDLEKKNLTWQGIRHHLEKDEAAIEIIRGYKEKENQVFYIALVVTPAQDAPRLVVLPDGKEMEGKNYSYYKNAVAFRVKDNLSYNLYWQPLRDVLPENIQTVYIAPDGIYNKISLNSLYSKQEQRFVLDELNVRMLSSTRELAEASHSVSITEQQQAYLFGYPNYRYEIENQHVPDSLKEREKPKGLLAGATSELYPFRHGITLLPGTEREINYVDDILHNFEWNTFKFMENIALEENIKQVKSPRLLHIATHGYFMSDLPLDDGRKAFGIHLQSMAANPLLRSGLLLTGSENTILASEADEEVIDNKESEDGILTAYEAMNLDLNGTDLVVLSACETGLGEVKNGEGVYGLQRAFMVAGANSVMMSLWKVNDIATTELIRKFYTYWLEGQDKFTALRNAQLKIKEEYKEPYYWGAFVLMGR